ncbi:MAG: histidine kinase [Algicola sp.]|nr:histidine kinase [Algicola sp.]
MKTLLLHFLTLLLGLVVHHSHAQSDVVPTYKGDEIDLTTFKVATLYKGADKRLVAQRLNITGIADLVRLESNQWHITVAFNASKAVIDERDIWLQLRSNISAAEIHINGHHLFSNGIVGTSKLNETTGRSMVRQFIPRAYLVDGRNNLTVRFSNFHHQHGALFRDLSIGNLTELSLYSNVMSIAPLVFSGIFLFAIFVNLALYFSLNRKKVFALLATTFLFNFVLMAIETMYWNGLLNTVTLADSYTLRRTIEALIYFCLIGIIHFEFELTTKHLLGAITLFAAALLPAMLFRWPAALVLGVVALGFAVFGMIKKPGTNHVILASLLIITLFNVLDEFNLIEQYDFVFSHPLVTSVVFKLDNLGMIVFALLMIFSSAKNIWNKTQALNQTQLKLAKLEYQFVQKHIQPHFLMNSLMSLQQLVNKDPETAGEMIEALSEEFHLLTIMSKQKLVPIQQEIDMCHTHLKIMSIQQRAQYQLKVQGINGDEQIPPAIFHTLVENGITHGYSGNESAAFLLTKESTATGMSYKLFNNGKVTPRSGKKESAGSGLNYIKAQLEAWRPGQWTLTAGEVEGGWETVIKVNETI